MTVRRFKQVKKNYLSWGDYVEGDYVNGTLISTFESEYRKQVQTNYVIKVMGSKLTNLPNLREGELLVINGNRGMKHNIAYHNIIIGSNFEVEYGGKVWIDESEGTFYHSVEITPDEQQQEVQTIDLVDMTDSQEFEEEVEL